MRQAIQVRALACPPWHAAGRPPPACADVNACLMQTNRGRCPCRLGRFLRVRSPRRGPTPPPSRPHPRPRLRRRPCCGSGGRMHRRPCRFGTPSSRSMNLTRTPRRQLRRRARGKASAGGTRVASPSRCMLWRPLTSPRTPISGYFHIGPARAARRAPAHHSFMGKRGIPLFSTDVRPPWPFPSTRRPTARPRPSRPRPQRLAAPRRRPRRPMPALRPLCRLRCWSRPHHRRPRSSARRPRHGHMRRAALGETLKWRR
mmetsp:Transcript_416/g.1863  ORF Transcript_416/g.1863 Transcript_416/m.1863 type:complete len:258 (+) Transcript_416:2-775(+)